MTDYREILRLRGLQYSQRAIARSVRCSRNTVEKVLAASAQLHLAWPLFDDVTNADLERFLFPDKHKASSQYAEPDYPYSHREHYGTAIVPARVRKPRDKSSAEASVRFAETWIVAALRDRKFFSLRELNEAVAEKLAELNSRPFKQMAGCRRSAYLEEEKPYMLPLPASAYESAVWSVAKVANDYFVADGRNKYSVPYNLIGERVDIRVTKEVFYLGSRVASHRRLQTRQRDPLVKREHMPPEHQKYLTYNADEFSRWAMSVGPMTEKVADHFLKSGKAAEQGYKACADLSKLEQRYGKQRLEAACGKALVYSTAPALRTIASILKNGLDKPDKAESQLPQSKANSYGITRGAAYFRKGGDRGC